MPWVHSLFVPCDTPWNIQDSKFEILLAYQTHKGVSSKIKSYVHECISFAIECRQHPKKLSSLIEEQSHFEILQSVTTLQHFVNFILSVIRTSLSYLLLLFLSQGWKYSTMHKLHTCLNGTMYPCLKFNATLANHQIVRCFQNQCISTIFLTLL